MPRTDDDPLGDGFRRRLRVDLDRVQPRFSPPRYLASPRRAVSVWRLAPAGLAAGVAGMLVLTAYAATGSPNPVVWTQKIVSVIDSGPTVQSSPAGHAGDAAPMPTQRDDGSPKAGTSESPEPSEAPEHGESPAPSGGDASGSVDSGGYGSSRSGEPPPSPGNP